MAEFKDITPKHFHCPAGDCPSVHISDDGKLFRITGELIALPGDEATIEISAELLLQALAEGRQ